MVSTHFLLFQSLEILENHHRRRKEDPGHPQGVREGCKTPEEEYNLESLNLTPPQSKFDELQVLDMT